MRGEATGVDAICKSSAYTREGRSTWEASNLYAGYMMERE